MEEKLINQGKQLRIPIRNKDGDHVMLKNYEKETFQPEIIDITVVVLTFKHRLHEVVLHDFSITILLLTYEPIKITGDFII